jgi:sugar/nucleoside kinase (ribokinase family)
MSASPIDVLGIGNAIVDVIAHAEDAFLDAQAMPKGGMALIDEARAESIYADMGAGIQASGGSAGNTIAGIASLGGKPAYIGKVKDDVLGQVFRHDLRAMGVRFDTPAATDGPATARCLILVTPDAQRTMNTFLGACVNLTPDDIDEALVAAAGITYLEGYLFDPPHAKEAFRKAAKIARNAGRKVALSLSDSFCVGRYRDEFRALIEDHIDIVFANEDEITTLYQADLATAAAAVSASAGIAAITLGAKGSLIASGSERVEIPVAKVTQVVDTTGAGDLYAAGVLHGLSRGLPLAECGRLGSIAAGEIISHFGARPETPLAGLVKAR